MKKASDFFTSEQQQHIADAVKAAETRTVGEIVPVLATASGRYDRAEDIVGLLTALIVLTAGWIYCPAMHTVADWSHGALPSVAGLLTALGCVVAGFIAGSGLATWIPALRLPFILPAEMREEVQRSARVAFMQQRVRKTAASTGVLIYVSLFERQVVILPDHGISELHTPDVWQEVRDLLIDGLRRGDGAAGFQSAIAKCGDLLASSAPREDEDTNELPNTLQFVD